jgi:hypothetical protein
MYAKRQQSLVDWGKQKWRTKSGKKSSVTGERYLPENAIRALTPAEYAATTRSKRLAKRKENSFLNNLNVLQRKQQGIDNG